MAFVEKTAKTVEEAVAAALSELNITAEEAVIEVLEEGKKGLFGFFGKDAKVRVTAKEVVVEETVVETAAPEAAPVVETVVETEVKEEAPVATEERVAREPKKFVVSDESVAKAREFLQKVFNAMKIDVVMEKFVNKNDGTVTFKLHGADMGILIGKHGQTLDSLQYLTNLVANKNSAPLDLKFADTRLVHIRKTHLDIGELMTNRADLCHLGSCHRYHRRTFRQTITLQQLDSECLESIEHIHRTRRAAHHDEAQIRIKSLLYVGIDYTTQSNFLEERSSSRLLNLG